MVIRRRVVVLVAAIACVFSAGRCSAEVQGNNGHQTKRLPTPTPTVTIEKTVTKTVTKYLTPESCLKALSDLEKISAASSRLADVGLPELDLMSRSHQAIADHDSQKLVQLQSDQMKLNDQTVGDVKDLEVDWLPQMKLYAKQCRETIKK